MAEEVKTYRGNCHCTAFVFEVMMPEIKKLNGCNCSYCHKQAFLYARLKGESDLKVEKGKLSDLVTYRFGPKGIDHMFCGTCGTSLIVRGSVKLPSGDVSNVFAVNARSFQHGLLPNFWDMQIESYDAAEFNGRYKAPEFDGPKPEVEVEGGKYYTGSCHCGAVRLGVNSKPLDKTYKEFATECNCSFDNRAGCSWVYPAANQVSVKGEENVTFYKFNLGAWGKGFCKTCGVYLYGKHYKVPDEIVANMSDQAKEWIVGGAHLRPLNVRVLNEFDFKGMNFQHTDGYSNIPPGYVEP